MKKAKFEKKTLSYKPEYSWQTPLVLDGAYCYGGLAAAKQGKGGLWLIYVEKTGACVSQRHAFRNLRSAKAAIVGLASIEGINWRLAGVEGTDWYSDNPLKDPCGRSAVTRENIDSVRQILECCERWA